VRDDEEVVDLAIIGAGLAGTWLAQTMQAARPQWAISVFERNDRIGGRLRSMRIPGLAHPIELGGMRYMSSHRRVQSVVTEFGIRTRAFATHHGPERTFLRGRHGNGSGDPNVGTPYDLPEGERGRSASDLTLDAFLRIVPGADQLDASGWERARATGTYLGRRLTDWSISDALATVRSPAGHRFTTDSFGYDSGFRPFNVGDAIEYLLGGGDPTAEAVVPEDGMDRIPRALAERFEARGGTIRLRQELRSISVEAGLARLRFADGSVVAARHAVLTAPIPALWILAADSPVVDTPAFRRIYEAVEGYPATKLYLWYERPWWRDGAPGPAGNRATTDLPARRIHYFDERPEAPAAILAAYTDGRYTAPWVALAGGASNGQPAPAALLEAAERQLSLIHPWVRGHLPRPLGSAFMHWGSDPRETGWPFWRAGYVSDEVTAASVQPEPGLPIHLAGDTFSGAQGWSEGAVETAELVAQRLLAESA